MDAKVGLNNLILVRDALTALNVRYFLMDGTLLGLMRNGCFIEWDDDIDIGVLAEDFTMLSFARYMSIMKRNAFERCRLFGVWGKYFVAHWYRNNIRVDICFYFRRGDRRIGHMFDTCHIIEVSYPASLIETLAPVDLYDQTFMAPKDKEAVLCHNYGDWRTPTTDWDWRTSPRSITLRTKITKWRKVQSLLSRRILRLSGRLMERAF